MSGSDLQITATHSLARLRACEWITGLRPSSQGDAESYFGAGVDGGLYTAEQANELLRRHRVLKREEEEIEAIKGEIAQEVAAHVRLMRKRRAAPAESCVTCQGAPPAGFSCNTCGLGQP